MMSRSKWKNPFTKTIIPSTKTKKKIIIKRSYEITPSVVGKTVQAYNGKIFIKLNITDEMIGHKVGEFVPTRVKFAFKKKRKTNKK